jgi:hypothetical protein
MAFRFGIRRRWLRISLRTFLVLILVLCAWLAYVSNRARKQEELVRRMVHEGRGVVSYHHEIDAAGNSIPGASLPGPAWLRRLVGDHAFLRLRAVGTYNATEDDLRLISQFPSIEWLSLDARLRDEGMEQVARLRNLKELELEAPHVTDRGLAHVARLHKLERLAIGYARITDAGLKHLAELSNLKSLLLDRTQVTGEGVNWLRKRIPSVAIYPENSPFAAEEREIVERLIENGARFGADKEGHVAEVMFFGRDVGDDDLMLLSELNWLKRLDLIQTRVTSAGVNRVRETHPKLEVYPQFREPLAEEAAVVAALQLAGAKLFFDKLGHVSGLEQFDERFLTETLASATELSELKSMTLAVPHVGLEDCKHLGRIRSLELLWCAEADFNDAKLAELSKLHELKKLRIGVAEATDAGVARLGEVPALEELELGRAAISGPGLAKLKHLTVLHVYSVPPAEFTDRGLAHVAGLTRLRKMTLDFTQITDEGVRHFEDLVELETLSLNGSQITDAGLMHLGQALPKLKSLYVEDTQVTSDGVQEFQRVRPGCKVRY